MEVRFEGWNKNEEWTTQVAALLKSGWLGVGYTMMNVKNGSACKRAVYASDSAAEQLGFEAWVQQRTSQGYVPTLRYYIAKSPCPMADSEFAAPVVLRHTSMDYEVIVEMVLAMGEPGASPKTLFEFLGSKAKLDAFCRRLDLEGTCEQLALVADMKSCGGSVVFANIVGRKSQYSALSRPQPIRVGHKLGRNGPCPCSSGKKLKKCCGGVN